MRIAREHVDGLNFVAGDFPFHDLTLRVIQGTLLDFTMPFDDDELLPFGVMSVLALGDAGLGDVDADLSAVEGVHQLSE